MARPDGPDASSFKEWREALDQHQQPVYMERWQRLPEGGWDFLALYCPGPRPAVLCVVGDHFAFTEDRRELPNFEGATTGGCASLADWAWTKGDRKSLEALLSLEGSYGRVSTGWKISHSTLPWREGSVLLQPGQVKLAKGEL